jgi:hypothetical protein
VKEQRPFRPKIFLYRMLAAVFLTQAGFLAASFYICSRPVAGTTIQDRCPSVGQKAESLLLAATATTLSLLTGADDPIP